MTFNITIDGAKALELLAHRVKDHEGYIYGPLDATPSCRYEYEGCPSCLIGWALFDAGVPVEALAEMDQNQWDEDGQLVTENSIGAIELPAGLKISDKGLVVFHAAQVAQDSDRTWGYAFQAAVEAAANFGSER